MFVVILNQYYKIIFFLKPLIYLESSFRFKSAVVNIKHNFKQFLFCYSHSLLVDTFINNNKKTCCLTS